MWEYRTLLLTGKGVDLINKFGKEGWELVSIIPGLENRELTMAYLKRQAKNVEGSFIKNETELLAKFRAMVLKLIEDGTNHKLSTKVKKEAYDLIDSCYDEDGELIA